MGYINKGMQDAKNINSPQVKICGLTDVDEALGCANLGADAIGFVFFEKSPRIISKQTARKISYELPANITTVGVFVNETFSDIMRIVEYCNLKAVQLHGNETSKLVRKLLDENLIVIKALFSRRKPSFKDISDYNASGFLVECGEGVLPGGNAQKWNWEEAQSIKGPKPVILAGGLSLENVSDAIYAGLPDAVDVSSGVEISPGKKDLHKVRSFIKAVFSCDLPKKINRIF